MRVYSSKYAWDFLIKCAQTIELNKYKVVHFIEKDELSCIFGEVPFKSNL